MRLLIVTNNPQGASFRQRVQVYLDILRDRDIQCEVAQLPVGMSARARLFRQARRFDGVFLHKKKLNLPDACLLRRYARRVIYNYDDAIMYNEKTPDRTDWWRKRAFARMVRLADMVIVGSEYLAAIARPYSANVQILPIGLRTADYDAGAPSKEDGKIRLVWIGSRHTLAYLRQLDSVLEEIGRRYRETVLRVICDDFLDLADMPVEKRRWSARTRAANLATSDIGLAPLPDDPFTRGKCSFKVLEYSASGLPVVASPVGTNGQYVREGITGFLCTMPGEWVDRIGRLVENREMREAMGHAGREYARGFDVHIIGGRFADLIHGCLGDKSAPATPPG